VLVEDDNAAARLRRAVLGVFLSITRGKDGLSVEAAASAAGLQHQTWRRLEDGYDARAKTYAALEAYYDLPTGLIRRALADDGAMVELAGALGVDTSAVADGKTSATDFLASFTSGRPGVLLRHVSMTYGASSPSDDDLGTVATLVARLSARNARTPAEDAALSALIAWMGELASAKRG